MIKRTIIQGIKLDKWFMGFSSKEITRQEIFNKFEMVWGTSLADHFLSKYSTAESLIHALDSDNLELFMQHF